MRGVFVSDAGPGVWRFVATGRGEVLVHQRCRIPAVYLLLFEYEFDVGEKDGKIFLNKCVYWRPAPFNHTLGRVLFGTGTSLLMLETRRAPIEDYFADGHRIDESVPAHCAWWNFRELNALYLLTGEWALHPAPVRAAVRARDLYRLASEFGLRLRPGWAQALSGEQQVGEDLRLYNYIVDKTAEVGYVVAKRYMGETFVESDITDLAYLIEHDLLVMDEEHGVALRWAFELARAFRAAVADASFLAPDAPEPAGAAVYPELGAVTVVRDAHRVSVRELLAREWPAGARVVAKGDFFAAGDRLVAARDLPLTALRGLGHCEEQKPREVKLRDFAHLVSKGARAAQVGSPREPPKLR